MSPSSLKYDSRSPFKDLTVSMVPSPMNGLLLEFVTYDVLGSFWFVFVNEVSCWIRKEILWALLHECKLPLLATELHEVFVWHSCLRGFPRTMGVSSWASLLHLISPHRERRRSEQVTFSPGVPSNFWCPMSENFNVMVTEPLPPVAHCS
jgi:hypothetical protein